MTKSNEKGLQWCHHGRALERSSDNATTEIVTLYVVYTQKQGQQYLFAKDNRTAGAG